MSRTFRRKNAWDEYKYVDAWIDDYAENEDYLQGFKYYGRGAGKYHGCTVEQIREKLFAKYHGETHHNWNRTNRAKEFSRWFLRNRNKMELIEALKRGEEESLLLTERREVVGVWWWYD